MDLDEIRKALDSGIEVEYTMHCLKRMLERGISREDVINCVKNGEIIEDYPLDKGLISEKSVLSCLVLGWKKKDPIHVVVGYNGEKILMISAMVADLQHWMEDYKTRRK